MLIESLLIGGIAGCLSYACKIVYSNMVAEDSSVEVDNIVKYEYHPIDYIEQVGLKDKIIFKYIEGEKDGVKARSPISKYYLFFILRMISPNTRPMIAGTTQPRFKSNQGSTFLANPITGSKCRPVCKSAGNVFIKSNTAATQVKAVTLTYTALSC